MSNISSNAYNFQEYISAGVDPRTGMFTMTINLGNFISHKGTGIKIPLVLSYNPSDSTDHGFGRGWSLPLSQFDASTSSLKLSTGQSFQIVWNDVKGEYDIPYRKLKDIRVFYLSDSSEIKVVFKDGRHEYLSYEEGVVKRVVTPQGLEIHFEYEMLQSRQTLWKVSDGAGRDFYIDWWSDEYQAVVSHYVNNIVFQEFHFYKHGSDKTLRSFSLPGCSDPTEIDYGYFAASGYKVIERVVHASGLVDEISYRDGHALPDGAPISHIPYVHSHTMHPGANQGVKYTEYDFSDHNYLGFGSDRQWSASEDTLFKAARNYRYTSTETVNGSKKTIREYNKYHLLESAYYYDDGTLYKEDHFTYFADLDAQIEHQPAQYTLLKEQRSTFHQDGQSRTTTLHHDYDEYANHIREEMSDGSIITRSYYPSAGETGRCPAEPNGMVALLKEEIATPNPLLYEDAPKKTVHTYQAIPKLDDRQHYFVVLAKLHDDTQSIIYSYYQDRSDRNSYGRMASDVTTINGTSRTVSYRYAYLADYFKMFITTTTHDDLQIHSSEAVEYRYLQPIEQVDELGIKSLITYDSLGRQESTTVAPETEYSVTIRRIYHLGANQNTLTDIDASGNRRKSEFNNAGNIIKIWSKGKRDAAYKCIREMSYDTFGLLVKQTDTDWLGENPIHISKVFSYDSFAQVKSIIHSDGREERVIQNPVTLTLTNEQVGLVTEFSAYNFSGQVIEKITRDKQGKVLARSQYEYDGYGNQTKVIDTAGRVIVFQYDKFDRIISSTRHIDGTAVTESFRYAPFTGADLRVQVLVNNTQMGTRTYDGLGRITAESSSAGARAFYYDGIFPLPERTTTPNGEEIRMIYDLYLKQPVSQSVVGHPALDNAFKYDKKTGLARSGISQGAIYHIEYDSYGRVTAERYQFSNGTEHRAAFYYSTQGKLLQEIDYANNSKRFVFDEFGRVNQVIEHLAGRVVETTIDHDRFSRPYRYTVLCDDQKTELALTHNAIGLEAGRTIRLNDRDVFSITQTYNDNLLVTTRLYVDANGSTTETFGYDDFNRLIEYTSHGPNSPVGDDDSILQRQIFRHDIYGNITRTISEFADGTSNTARFTYDPTAPARLLEVRNNHPDYPAHIRLRYDAAGNMLNDDQGREYVYNAFGQVEAVKSAQSQLLSEYRYDASGKLISQSVANHIIHLLYMHDTLAHEVSGDVVSSYTRYARGLTGRQLTHSTEKQHQMLLGNAQGSVLQSVTVVDKAITGVDSYTYSPYGESKS